MKSSNFFKKYLSYGAGVNSEALRLLLLDQGIDFEAVYVDHGCDWPETREFAKTIPDLTILTPNIEGFSSLYEYCLHYRLVPSLMLRFCTSKFKIQPLYQYFEQPCICYIGIGKDEVCRCKKSRNPNIHNQFPLVVEGMDRQDCKQYIADHHLEVPGKSGCWFCPMQSKRQWRKLAKMHPDLYKKAKILEQANMNYRKKQGKIPLALSVSRKRLEVITMEGQMELFEI